MSGLFNRMGMAHRAFGMHEPKDIVFVDSCLFSLSTLMTIMSSVACIHTCCLMIHHPVSGGMVDRLIAALFVGGLYITLFGTMFILSYSLWGHIRFLPDRFILCAPLRRRIAFCYSDIRHIVIDYSLESNQKLVWVVLSKTPIDSKYIHKVNRMPINSNQVRIVYSSKLDSALKRHLSETTLKQYYQCCSSLKIYGDNSTP